MGAASLGAERGFTLVEVLVALVLLSFLFLSGLTLAAVEFRTQRRLAVHAEAERALEATYEQLRAGAVPLRPGDLEVPFFVSGGRMQLEVEPLEIPDLYRFSLTAIYRADDGEHQRELEGLLWHP